MGGRSMQFFHAVKPNKSGYPARSLVILRSRVSSVVLWVGTGCTSDIGLFSCVHGAW
jgi:hypothetical protein